MLFTLYLCKKKINYTNFLYHRITPADYRDRLAATTLGDKVTPFQGVLTEAWITCMLVITILGSTNMRRKGELYMATLPIGFAVMLGIMAAVSVLFMLSSYQNNK